MNQIRPHRVSTSPSPTRSPGGAPVSLPTPPAVQAAFFDVDETLITIKSMFDFLRFYLHWRGHPEDTYDRLVAELHAAAQAGTPREEINRHYYRLYAGESADALAHAGRRWFEATVTPATFIPTPLAALRHYQTHGVRYGLVSGSFSPCLDPIGEYLHAAWIDASEPVIRHGRLTGEIAAPMIGVRKAVAVRTRAVDHHLDLGHCAAYADHASDLAMLGTVGYPVVVGDDPILTAHAIRLGWPQLPATP